MNSKPDGSPYKPQMGPRLDHNFDAEWSDNSIPSCQPFVHQLLNPYQFYDMSKLSWSLKSLVPTKPSQLLCLQIPYYFSSNSLSSSTEAYLPILAVPDLKRYRVQG